MKYFLIVPGFLLLITHAKVFNTSLSLTSVQPLAIRVITQFDCSLEPPSTSERSYTRWRRYLKCAMYKPQATPTPIPSLVPEPTSTLGTSVCSNMNSILSKRTNVRMRRYIQCLWINGTIEQTPTPSPTPEHTCNHEPPNWSGKRALVRWRRYLLLEPNCPIGKKENATATVLVKRIESQAYVDLSGQKYLDRLIAVYLFRSKTWIMGIPPGWPCQVTGTRCSLGYYCKCFGSYCTCRLLVYPREIIATDEIKEPSLFQRDVGMSCNFHFNQCRKGLECRQFAEYQYYCVKGTLNSTDTLSYTYREYANSTVNITIPPTVDELITKPDESSHVKANEYDIRGFTVYMESKSWVQGLPEGSSCTDDGERCSLGLSCKLNSNDAKVCTS